ncbi:hypothetical protein [Paraburkholderia sp. BCC1884]|uniref:hypothetical protein n=1 Tax=Paraburkholderia sp. BCC1884 TaxID=2562668 RepID=UPI0011827A83|nr:hypothetical protein [Paraburkholderia sp. BCC1884]
MKPSVNLDGSQSPVILADASRLGQIVFHMIDTVLASRENRDVIVAVRTEPLNAGSQRVLIDVSGLHLAPAPASTRQADSAFDPALAFCRMLAERMRGTLRVEHGHAAFEAPFTIHAIKQLDMPIDGPSAKQESRSVVSPSAKHESPSKELFDRSYLDALVKEGIDLKTFLRGWHRAMQDDLACMRACRNDYRVAMRSTLHKLSGATGLVGAKSVATALREAGATSAEPEGCTIDVLTTRLQTLMTQLDEAAKTAGSDRQ